MSWLASSGSSPPLDTDCKKGKGTKPARAAAASEPTRTRYLPKRTRSLASASNYPESLASVTNEIIRIANEIVALANEILRIAKDPVFWNRSRLAQGLPVPVPAAGAAGGTARSVEETRCVPGHPEKVDVVAPRGVAVSASSSSRVAGPSSAAAWCLLNLDQGRGVIDIYNIPAQPPGTTSRHNLPAQPPGTTSRRGAFSPDL